MGPACALQVADNRDYNFSFSPDRLRDLGVDRRWIQWIQEGMYADTLRVWQAQYGRENVLALRYEDLLASPRAQLSRVFDHVGVGTQRMTEEIWASMEDRVLGRIAHGAVRRLEGAKVERGSGLVEEATYRELSDFYRPFNEDLARITGDDSFLKWGKATG